MDRESLRGLSRLRGIPVSGVLRGVLRRSVPGAARRRLGDSARGGLEHVPELGLPGAAPDLLRAPLREGRPVTSRTTDPADVRIDVYLHEGALATLAEDVQTGLTSTPKTLPPKYFYDSRGSELF